MALGDRYKITAVFSRGATVPEMTTGFYLQQRGVTAFGVTDTGPLVKAWWDTELNSSGMTNGMKDAYDNTVSLVAVKQRRIDPLEPVEQTYTSGLPITGDSAGDQTLPAQDAPLLSLRTGFIGRSYRGRMYLPPIGEAEVDENLTLARAQAYADQAAGLFQSINGSFGSGTVVVWSPKLSDAFQVTEVKCDIFIRSQRRRATRPAFYEAASL